MFSYHISGKGKNGGLVCGEKTLFFSREHKIVWRTMSSDLMQTSVEELFLEVQR